MDEKKIEEAMVESIEQSFNDDELKDIMSEIESLEEEFVDDKINSSGALALDQAKSNVIQDEIDTEVEQMSKDVASELLSSDTPIEVDSEIEEADQILDEVSSEEPELEASSFSEEQDQGIPDNVVPLASVESKVEDHRSEESENCGVHFSASGSMNLNLNFKIGNEEAKLSVENNSLVISMNGASINITEDKGFQVTMDNGVSFSVPLQSVSANKKAA